MPQPRWWAPERSPELSDLASRLRAPSPRMGADGHGPRATSRSEPAARPAPTSLSIAPTEATRWAPIEPRGPRSPRKPEGHFAALRHEPSSAVPDDPVENPVEESPKTEERPLPNLSKRAVYLGFRWWRGQDLNLRPSGYERDDQLVSPYHRVPDRALLLGFRVRSYRRRASPYRPLLPDLAEDLADARMQDQLPNLAPSLVLRGR